MKIALFVHCFYPEHYFGTEKYTLDLALHLKGMGHDVVVVTARNEGEKGLAEVVTTYRYRDLLVYIVDKNFVPMKRIRDKYYQPEMRDILRGILIDIAPDIVHVTHIYNHSAVLLEVVREMSIPCVATLTDFFGICHTSHLRTAAGKMCDGPNARRTNCLSCNMARAAGMLPMSGALRKYAAREPMSTVLATSISYLTRLARYKNEWMSEFVGDVTGMAGLMMTLYRVYGGIIAPTRFLKNAYVSNGLAGEVRISHFGVDISRDAKPEPTQGAPLRFAYIGQLLEHKGVDILVDAFCALPAGSAELEIYGKEEQHPAFTEALKEKARGHAITFRGTFPPELMSDVLKEIDFVVIPSRWYENSPLVLLNSLASHTPVIISNAAGMTEFVEEGRNGYIFKMGSVSDLLRVMKSIVARPDEARRLVTTTHYDRTTAAMTEDVVALYSDVLNASASKVLAK
jgi:glycosyltransferase involved in cell wall biosynthesis